IEERFPGRWIGKVVAQALPRAEVERYRDYGIRIYHPNYEVWDARLFSIRSRSASPAAGSARSWRRRCPARRSSATATTGSGSTTRTTRSGTRGSSRSDRGALPRPLDRQGRGAGAAPRGGRALPRLRDPDLPPELRGLGRAALLD